MEYCTQSAHPFTVPSIIGSLSTELLETWLAADSTDISGRQVRRLTPRICSFCTTVSRDKTRAIGFHIGRAVEVCDAERAKCRWGKLVLEFHLGAMHSCVEAQGFTKMGVFGIGELNLDSGALAFLSCLPDSLLFSFTSWDMGIAGWSRGFCTLNFLIRSSTVSPYFFCFF